MKKDINEIIDVESDEVNVLITMIETLFEETYIAQHKRAEKIQKLNEIAANKKLE